MKILILNFWNLYILFSFSVFIFFYLCYDKYKEGNSYPTNFFKFKFFSSYDEMKFDDSVFSSVLVVVVVVVVVV